MIQIYLERYKEIQGMKKRELEHELGNKLLCQGLKDLYGMEIENPPVLLKGEHGKPYLKDFPRIHFNISHTEGMAVCGIGSRPLGIDIEAERPYKENVLRRVLSEAERRRLEELPEAERSRRFFCIWTLKESYVKAKGLGLTIPLTDISFEFGENGNISCSVPGTFFHQKFLEGGYILSLCTFGEEEISFVQNPLSSAEGER